jgi:hypothetical protein
MSAQTDTLTRRGAGRALLRRALQLDATGSGAMGIALLAGGGVLDSAFGVSSTLLWSIGTFFVLYAAALFFLASRVEINRVAAWIVVAGNVLWAVDSIAVLAAGRYDLTLLGEVIVLAQTAAVLGFASLQYLGLRRSA